MPWILLFLSALLSACATSSVPLHTRAPSDFINAYRQTPYAPAYAYPYAASLSHHGHTQQALTVMEGLLQHADPDNLRPEDYILAGKLYGEQNTPTLQKAVLTQARKQYPKSFPITSALVGHYHSTEKFDKAEQLLNPLLNTRPYLDALSETTFALLMDQAAVTFIQQDKIKQAYTLIKDGKKRYPHNRIIERTRRIVTALLQSEGYDVPKPGMRPMPSQKGQPL